MFNLPPNIFNNRYLQGLAGNSKKWSEVSPFRKVEGIGQYGNGLNASASQLYEHFSGAQNARGRKYWEHGLKPINPREQIQSLQDFNSRWNPTPATPSQPPANILPPKLPTSGIPGLNIGNLDLSNFNPSGIFNLPPNVMGGPNQVMPNARPAPQVMPSAPAMPSSIQPGGLMPSIFASQPQLFNRGN